ncbi:TetR/AcrR family transcriptional regulator [Actinomadura rugatobispora]|uniref:TetR/AcrR family transcriptional regulator n=1 Tax=Actinomadura rugatobispora TaxID=1994 RepID=A0ABW0ZR91_9ACTN|nr:TetR/AcrR family transcriptional regulator [Actinomadura rugatobispora]
MAGTGRTSARGGAATKRSAREPARDRILRTATDLFYTYGIRGVGIDRIIAESGVAKATLYAHFRSKDELVLAYLRQADEKWRRMLREAAAAAGDDPRAQLPAMFNAIGAPSPPTDTAALDAERSTGVGASRDGGTPSGAEGLREGTASRGAAAGSFRGCAFINSASESQPGSPVHEATIEHKRLVREWVEGLAAKAGAADPALLARQLTVLLDGAMSAASTEPVPDVIPAARAGAQALVAAACP